MPKMRVGDAQAEAKAYGKTLEAITDDDDFINAWADLLREEPAEGEKDAYFLKRTYAELVAVQRFDLGNHMKRLYEKHPDLKLGAAAEEKSPAENGTEAEEESPTETEAD